MQTVETKPATPRPLVLAVPGLETHFRGDSRVANNPQSGVGRVFASLQEAWGERVRLVGASLEAPNLPLLRNLPRRVRLSEQADWVFLPRTMGATALQNTGGIPSLAVVHDLGLLDMAFSGDRPVDWWSHQVQMAHFRAVRHATRIITVSEFTRERLLHHFPQLEGRVRVAPNGVSLAFLNYRRSQPEALARLRVNVPGVNGEPLLLYVGSESPRKNLPLLFRVLRELKERYPKAQLLKIGKSDHPQFRQEMLESLKISRLELGRDVLLLEGPDDDLLLDAYRAADVLVSTSLYEGFGLPALEALAVGTPVVVTNRASFPEVVGGLGATVEPRVDAFVQRLETLLHHPPSEVWREAARAHAARFSWKASAEKYLEILKGGTSA
jgi:glycosyltransferase involved in cell wall biosynthesis